MYKNDFDSLKEWPFYLVFFGHPFFLNLYQKKIENKFKKDNIIKIYYDEFDKKTAKNFLLENSLFGGKNILIIKTKKFNKDLEELKKYAKNNYCFIFYEGNQKISFNSKKYCYINLNFKTKIELKENEFIRFFEPSFEDIMKYINFLCEKENLSLSIESKQFLAKSIEPIFLENEIKKLANYNNEISLRDIKELVFLYRFESLEELFEKILKGEEFFEDLNNILEIEDYKRIIPAFVKYLTMIYKIYLFIKVNGSFDSKKLFGYKLPPKIEENRVNLALKLKENDYKKLFDYLLNKELLIRSSNRDKEAIFWEVMIYLRNYHSF
jgi:DNA polymerase-3 subunit delta